MTCARVWVNMFALSCPPLPPPPVFQLNLFRIFSLYHALRESFSVWNVCIINTTRPAVIIGKPWKLKSECRSCMWLWSLVSNLDLNLGDFRVEFGFGHRLVNNTSWHLRNTTHSPGETRETKCLTNKRGLDIIITLPDVWDQEKGGSILWSSEHMVGQRSIDNYSARCGWVNVCFVCWVPNYKLSLGLSHH